MSEPKTTAEILEERGREYGSFARHARISRDLKTAAQWGMGGKTFDPVMAEALDMIFHKIARILNGNPMNRDSWADIAGYAELVVKEIDADADAGKNRRVGLYKAH